MSNKLASSNIVRTVVGAGLILLGILFLVGRHVSTRFNIDFGHYTWPLFIIIPGLVLFIVSFVFEQRAGIILAIFGGVVTMTGSILLLQNTFDLYASWAYAWALVAPTSIGLANGSSNAPTQSTEDCHDNSPALPAEPVCCHTSPGDTAQGMGTPLVPILMMMPDFGALMLIGGILGIIIALAWPLLASSALRLGKKSGHFAKPVDTTGLPTGE